MVNEQISIFSNIPQRKKPPTTTFCDLNLDVDQDNFSGCTKVFEKIIEMISLSSPHLSVSSEGSL